VLCTGGCNNLLLKRNKIRLLKVDGLLDDGARVLLYPGVHVPFALEGTADSGAPGAPISYEAGDKQPTKFLNLKQLRSVCRYTYIQFKHQS
jgi:hypothetical protein